jgi:hypothetical protein
MTLSIRTDLSTGSIVDGRLVAEAGFVTLTSAEIL